MPNTLRETISITTADGGAFNAYVARPRGDHSVPCIIVIQEIFGVNAGMREICDHLSNAGYIAICPDLFWRQEKGVELTDKTDAEWQKAFALYNGFDIDKGVEDLKTTLAHARQMEGSTGRVGTIGYCLGGKLAFLMATRSDADCNVSYYGVDLARHLDEAAQVKKPLLMHIAEKDKYVPVEAQRQIIDAFKVNDHVSVNVYEDVDHAFARPNGIHFDKEAAHLANARTADFLAVTLAS